MCRRAHVEIVEVYGVHYWMGSAAERAAIYIFDERYAAVDDDNEDEETP